MAQHRQIDAVAQRADHYETAAGRELRQRAAARVRTLRDRDAITDGGTVADSGRETTVESVYTYHTEPPEQGGKAYVRCRDCQRELLVDLGGRDRLPHAPGCPQRRGENR
ncbi:hypothetical protein [Saliphagus infecundisoli]|uniref:DUF8118 domain-containing protein n=1 Tax=Saliphagus infecundisoli TaxID=1849069 RepID=A0ABD5Q9Y6_9EURY|nr:hypothetical protein [Saliphagus infecundisoli]